MYLFGGSYSDVIERKYRNFFGNDSILRGLGVDVIILSGLMFIAALSKDVNIPYEYCLIQAQLGENIRTMPERNVFKKPFRKEKIYDNNPGTGIDIFSKRGK